MKSAMLSLAFRIALCNADKRDISVDVGVCAAFADASGDSPANFVAS